MVLGRLREIMVEMYDDYSGTSSKYSGLADLFNPDDPMGDGDGTIEYFGNARDSSERIAVSDIVSTGRTPTLE